MAGIFVLQGGALRPAIDQRKLAAHSYHLNNLLAQGKAYDNDAVALPPGTHVMDMSRQGFAHAVSNSVTPS